MTRRSKRELERALDALAAEDGDLVRAWLNDRLTPDGDDADLFGDTDIVTIGADGEPVDSPGHADEVCIWRGSADAEPEIWIDEADVPEWIDPDEDLPVKA
jgi:hypothetical protein